MTKPIIFVCLLVWINTSFAQKINLEKITDSITNEGKTLYKSEWASWYGSDIFVEKCTKQRTLAGGYLSYDTGTGLNNIFFSRDSEPKVLATISFGYDYNSNNYKLDTISRPLNASEKELFIIRQAALADVNTDTIYKHYNNANLNIIPIITDKVKRVYVLTGPTNNGVILFGNDYLITFNNSNIITNKKKLHKTLIAMQLPKDSSNPVETQIGAMHTHLPELDNFITATDICTLMLYERNSTWNQHIVMSRDYISIWDCKRDKLAIMTKEAWDNMNILQNTLKNKPN